MPLDITSTTLQNLLDLANGYVNGVPANAVTINDSGKLETLFGGAYGFLYAQLATCYLLTYCGYTATPLAGLPNWNIKRSTNNAGFNESSLLVVLPSPDMSLAPAVTISPPPPPQIPKTSVYMSDAAIAQGSSFAFQTGVQISGVPNNSNSDGVVQYGQFQTTTSSLQTQITSIVNDGATLSNFKALQTYVDALGTTDQANLTSALASLTTTIDQSALSPFKLLPQVSVYADASPPIAQPSSVLAAGFDGHYYTNSVSGKINWYLPIPSGLTYSQIIGLSANVKLLSTGSVPFFNIYSTKKTTGSNSGSWYNQRETWDVSSSSPAAGSTCMIAAVQGSTSFVDNPMEYTPYSWVKSPSPFSTGTIAPSDTILAIAFSTNSAASLNAVQFILQAVNLTTSNGTLSFAFSNSDVQQLVDEATIAANNTAITAAVATANASLATTNSTATSNYNDLLSRIDALSTFLTGQDSSHLYTR